MVNQTLSIPANSAANGVGIAVDWQQLADSVLAGQPVTREQALAILHADDAEVPALVAAGFRLRHRYFGKTVQLYFLMNAKSGLCPEDCGYCSQSKVSEAEIPKYNLLSREKLLDGARVAAERDSKAYCIVISARGPNEREMRAITTVVPEIKEKYDLQICCCLGLLTPDQAQALKECGVDKVNHNLNSSAEHYEKICTTHTFADRLATLQAVRGAGMELCSGGIVGMGERAEDVVEMAYALHDLNVESIPVNFLNPIDGTPLEGLAISGTQALTPAYCLRVLAMFRFVNPQSEIRIAGGRELHLRSLQAMGMYLANSIFVGDYLTTKGQAPDADYQMIKDLGFEVTHGEEVAIRMGEATSSTV
jgi:biotin synthase